MGKFRRVVRESITKFLRRPTGLAFITLLLLAVSEGCIVATLFSLAYPGIDVPAFLTLLSAFVVLVFFYIVTPWPANVHVGFDLVRKSNDPRWAFLLLHFLYFWVIEAHVFLMTLLPFVWLTGGVAVNRWVLTGAVATTIGTVYSYLVMIVIGQHYESRRGFSFLGAGAYARIAEIQFEEVRPEGVYKLLNSLEISEELFKRRRSTPGVFDQVYATVETVCDMVTPPLQSLKGLAKALSLLPDSSQLPAAFSEFLTALSWPSGFMLEHKGRLGITTRRTLLVAIIPAIVGAVATGLIRGDTAVPQFLVGLSNQYSLIIITGFVLAIGFVASFTALGYSSPVRELWKRRSLS